MRKFLISWLIFLIILPILVSAQTQYFNPFKYGIKTVKDIKVIDNQIFLNEVRKKAAELLNDYFATTTFEVQGEKILHTEGANVNVYVQQSYGTWKNLLKEAIEEVLIDPSIRQDLGLGDYSQWHVVDLTIENNKLTKVYVAPAEYSGAFPVVSACKQGVGQCLLFLFDRALRILYTGSLVLGVIFLMWAGILYIINPEKVTDTHKRFQWGVIGIIVSIISFSIVIGLENWVISPLPKEEIAQSTLPGGGRPQPPEEDQFTTPVVPLEESESIPSGIQQPEESSQPTPVQTPAVSLPPATPRPETPSVKGFLIIDTKTAKIQDGRFSVFVTPQNGTCSSTYVFFNKTRPELIPRRFSENIIDPQFISADISYFAKPGEEIRVVFKSDCSLNISYLDLIYPREIVITPTPTLSFDLKGIRAQQYLRIELPKNLEDALEQALGLSTVQRNIYNPPFYLNIEYSVEPAEQSGYCTLYGTARGTSISSLSFDKTKATSLYIFNKDFSINLSYTKGKKLYSLNRQIYLPVNTIGFVYVKIYDYGGKCEVKNLPIEKIFDIETGKIYVSNQLGDIVKQILFGL